MDADALADRLFRNTSGTLELFAVYLGERLGLYRALADGTSGTVVYEDVVRRTSAGWRIARRTVVPRQRPLHP